MSVSLECRLPNEPVRPKPWWSFPGVREKLVTLATEEFHQQEPDVGGVYVHSLKYFRENFEHLKSLKYINKLFYAMKANPNVTLLKEALNLGSGIECVSLNELKLVLSIDPNICGTRVLFTPNFSSKAEYLAVRTLFETNERFANPAISQTLPFVTLDNLWCLQTWELVLFKGFPLFLRIDPGEDGHGHHSHVHTGSSSKFGITQEELIEFLSSSPRGRSIASMVVGLHMHKGSGLTDPTQWAKSAQQLLAIAPRFPNMHYVDLGGGIGIPYKPSAEPLDLHALDEHLAPVVAQHPNITFCIEPGRYVVAASGVLLARVHQLKSKGLYRFVGVSAGMNHLIRPALYDSYHHIVNLSRYDELYLREAAPGLDHSVNEEPFCARAAPRDSLVVNVVGPICESGDFLGQNRVFPRATQENDVVLVDSTGAYGRAMASQYNLRGPGPELVLDL